MERVMRSAKHVCQDCGKHNAKFPYNGRWRFSSDHDLCPRCYRSLMHRVDASIIASGSASMMSGMTTF